MSRLGGQLDPPDGPLVLTMCAGVALAVTGAALTTGGGFVLGYGLALMIHASAALHYQYGRPRRRRHHENP